MDPKSEEQLPKDADPGEENPPVEGDAGSDDPKDDGGSDAGADGDVKDKHGQPGINKERHEFDYQSGCHCSKTGQTGQNRSQLFDYQSGCHCSKTCFPVAVTALRLITSQVVTAPKL